MADPEVLAAKIDGMADRMVNIENTMGRLAEAMVQIARLESNMSNTGESIKRAFESISALASAIEHNTTALDARIRPLEDNAPVSKLVNGWVLAWIAGVVGLIGGAVATKILFP